jgi:sterol desaturase/sphingolipid hydroxylase (fatty acid hydroxylase superfamily)
MGTLQWSTWEIIFMYLWGSGRLPYIKDSEFFSTGGHPLKAIGWTLAIPLWREFHFYWCHRLIHTRVLYKQGSPPPSPPPPARSGSMNCMRGA